MRGTKSGIVIQQRDRQFLKQLATFRVVDREQTKVVGGFRSTTRVNARLLALTRTGLLRRFFLGISEGNRKAVYSLSPKGAAFVGVTPHGPRRPNDALIVADFLTIHQLAINDAYVSLKTAAASQDLTLSEWRSFYEPLAPNLRLIPDAYCELKTSALTISAFLEIDLGHERLKVWAEKVRHYLQFAISGEYTRKFGQERFRVLVISNSNKRLHWLRIATRGVTQKIFWFATADALRSQGPFAPIWLRPSGDEFESLLRS